MSFNNRSVGRPGQPFDISRREKAHIFGGNNQYLADSCENLRRVAPGRSHTEAPYLRSTTYPIFRFRCQSRTASRLAAATPSRRWKIGARGRGAGRKSRDLAVFGSRLNRPTRGSVEPSVYFRLFRRLAKTAARSAIQHYPSD